MKKLRKAILKVIQDGPLNITKALEDAIKSGKILKIGLRHPISITAEVMKEVDKFLKRTEIGVKAKLKKKNDFKMFIRTKKRKSNK